MAKAVAMVFAMLAVLMNSAQADQPADAAAQNGANAVPGADKVDEILTNANLRAFSGSKSRWSISNSITYDGGPVTSAFGEGRPNIANASGVSTDTDINDQISLKLSINPVNSILAGFGVRKMAPFTFSGPSSQYYASGGKDVDFYDPSLTYQYIYRLGPIQSVAQLSATQFTRADIHASQNSNLAQNYGFDQENVVEVGNLSIGVSIGFSVQTPTDQTREYSEYQYWFDPNFEYKLTDTVNLRTVSDICSYETWAQEGVIKDAWVQSVGVGISVTRDIFLYPNVQFLPQSANFSLTNVGVSATINLL